MSDLLLAACTVTLVAWQLTGVADWLMHRRTRIESTSGVREAAFHLAMLVQMGSFFLALLWLPAGALVLGACIALLVLHELTVYADLRWAVARRKVSALEQLIHSAQEFLPLVALALLAAAAWQAPEQARLSPLGTSLPVNVVVALHVAGAALFLLYAEELWRCLRADAGQPAAPHAGR